MKISLFAGFVLCAFFISIMSISVEAHGFGPRYDLPVPLYLYLSGAGFAVALSFVVMAMVVKAGHHIFAYPVLQLLSINKPNGLLVCTGVWALRGLSLSLFILTLVAGAFGDQEPVRNLAPTMVWIIFWVGLGIAVPLVGNIWEVINPWKIIFDLFDRITQKIAGIQLSLGIPYRKRYALVPGLIFLILFGWVENVYTDSAVPRHIALFGTSYAVSMLIGMVLFGKRTWLENGDVFTILFNRFAGFGLLELRNDDYDVCIQCELGCKRENLLCIDCYACADLSNKIRLVARPWAVGLVRMGNHSNVGKIFVIVVLAIVSFDGFSETPVWASIINTSLPWMATTFPTFNDVYFLLMVISSIGLIATVLIFLGAYQLTMNLMSSATRGGASRDELARGLIITLLPIAIAYHLAHYLSLFAVQGQLLIPLLSDPLGQGMNLFGTADYTVNIGVISSKFLWYFSVVVIVIGHVIAVYLAHVLSINIVHNRAQALKSQYPLIVLMIGYTVVSLWIIAQPITEVRIA